MVNILAQPLSVHVIHAVNILTTCFNQVPADLAEHLSPLTTHKSMQHILKNFATAFISANFQRTPLNSLKFEASLVTMFSFVGQNDIAKIKAHCKAEQLSKNECKFNFIDTYCKVLKTTIEGLGMITGMECIIKICANVCCVVTALFDIDGSNPVPILYSMCIKTIDFVKSLDFIQWHAIMHARVPQLPFIFLNMLQQILLQLAIYSTNTVNINLVECGDNGVNVSTVQLLKIAKLVACFFEQMENHILEGSYPDTVPAFTPRDANPNHKVPSMIAATNIEERSTAEKTKTEYPLLALLLTRELPKDRISSRALVQRVSRKQTYFVARKEHRLPSCSPPTSQRSIALSFVFTTKNAPSQSSLATLSMSASGKRSLPMIKPRFLNTVMPVVERSGSMWALFQA